MLEWFYGLFRSGREPDRFWLLADGIMPKGEGWGYYGSDVSHGLRLGGTHLEKVYLFIWGGTWEVTLSPGSYSKMPAWGMQNRKHLTRGMAVERLAESFRMIDEEVSRTDPGRKALVGLMERGVRGKGGPFLEGW